jgi:predicted nucleotidyltransferase component of viral defense system
MIKDWLAEYNPKNKAEAQSALREIMQEVALAGLYRGGFFEKAAFYGGTALRIFHGLDRFSEDLDFSLPRITSVDMEKVKADAVRFIPDGTRLDIWSRTYFADLAGHLKIN